MSKPAPVQRGAPEEFSSFFRSHIRYVCESLRRLGVPGSDVEDLAHEVFLTVYRRFDDYDRARPARPWLFAFALRVASGYRQQARVVRETIGVHVDVPTDDPDAEALLEQDGSRREVYAALAALSIERRIVFVMHELDERPMPAIAAELAIPVQTAYSRLHAARADFVAEIRRRARTRLEPRGIEARPREKIQTTPDRGAHGRH